MTQYTKPTVLPAWGESAGGADVLQPTNAEIQAGWPLSNVPPSRKRFNWILKYLAQGVRYMMQMGIPVWDATEDYPVNARVMGSNGKTYMALQTSTNQNPVSAPTYWQLWGTDGRDNQLQLTTAFTTAGTAPNFTLATTPSPLSLASGLRFRVNFHANGTGSDNLNISGLGSKSLKQYDSSGTKTNANIRAGLVDVEYDGTDLVVFGGSKGVLLVREEQPSGTNGGNSIIGMNTRTLNTINFNSISGASLSANRITLPPGTYRVQAESQCYSNASKLYLYNVTSASNQLVGFSVNGINSTAADLAYSQMDVWGIFTITTTSQFELRMYSQEALAAIGLGGPLSQGIEVYSQVYIQKD